MSSLTWSILTSPEKEVLLDFYRLDGGKFWKNATNWLNGDPCENNWYGVTCNEENTHIIEFFPNTRFSGNELVGPFPPSIGNWKWVEHLYLSNDRTSSILSGPLPEGIRTLKNLKCFYVSHGDLTGSLDVFSDLTNLSGLFLRVNRFSGPFPDLSKAWNLTHLWFDTNYISGNLSSLNDLKYLHTVNGFVNELTDQVPEHLCNINTCNLELNSFQCPLPEKRCCHIKECDSSFGKRDSRYIHHPNPLGNDGVCHPQ